MSQLTSAGKAGKPRRTLCPAAEGIIMTAIILLPNRKLQMPLMLRNWWSEGSGVVPALVGVPKCGSGHACSSLKSSPLSQLVAASFNKDKINDLGVGLINLPFRG
jgi:hypothetical protein